MNTKKRVTFLAIGSRGDLNPSFALAQELKKRQYDICIATHKNFESSVRDKNFDYAPIAGNYKNLLNTEVGFNFLEGKGKLRLIDDELFYAQLVDAYKACKSSDAIIVFPLSLFGYHIAEKLRIPCICSSYVPITPTKDFPFLRFDLEKTNKLSSFLNYFSYSLVNFLFWNADKKIINKFRQELNLAPIPFLGVKYRKNPPKNFKSEDVPILYKYSPHIIPRPSDWNNPKIHITGNWFANEAKNYNPSQELVKFINSGEKPIHIGFGSMTMRNPQKTVEILLEAIKKTKQRVIVSANWSEIERFINNESSNIFVSSQYIPFDWLFPQMKFVIHHGGSGTTALGLKAGIPQIIIPFFVDQPAWANKLHSLMVSPSPIPFKELSASRLIEVIKEVLNNPIYEQKAQEISELITQENGIKTAADLVEKYINDFAN